MRTISELGSPCNIMVVRNSWVFKGIRESGFADHAEFEQLKRKGDYAIKNWIDSQLNGTSVTVVLVGEHTCNSRWVKYEIDKSVEIGNGLLGIDISKINCLQRTTTDCCGKLPRGYSFYRWNADDGYNNMGKWIEAAAKAAGR